MVSRGKVVHHQHVRKRIYQNLEKYPHPNKWKRLMDKLIYAAGIIGPLMLIPQILKIWVDKNASGVSLISWLAFLVGSCFWLGYGIMHKEKPIIFAYSLWICFKVFLIIGIFLYGDLKVF